MKNIFATFALFLAAGASAQSNEPAPRSPFSNVGVSLNAGITGVGATVSTPLGKYFNLRAGFGVLPYSYTYTTDALTLDISERLAANGYDDVRIDPTNDDIDLKARLNVPATHLLVDYTPFKQGFGAFHLTAGLYMGGSNLLQVNGNADLDRLRQTIDGVRSEINEQRPGAGDDLDIGVRDFVLEMGEDVVHLADDGTLDAYAKVNGVKPYFGIGWGNAIPKRRVGFRFDLGAMYHGKPRITSPNIDHDMSRDINSDDDLNKILDKALFYPQLSFQITIRLLRDR